MPTPQTVLLLGGTGRTGQRVLENLLSRGVSVRVIVRSAHRLPTPAARNPNLAVTEASLLSLSDGDLQRHVCGCDAVISCLGHVLSFAGIFLPPRDLVTKATTRLCGAIEAVRPSRPVKLILMSSVSVNHPGGLDTRRGAFEKLVLWILRGLVPPAGDNQLAANVLYRYIGTSNPFVQWTVIRPDTLLEGDPSEYVLHQDLASSLFAPATTSMANIAHLICELLTDSQAWDHWKGKLPVIVNVKPSTTA